MGTNITLEDCEDTFHQVVVKAQQLFIYLVSEYARNRIQDSDSHSGYGYPTKKDDISVVYDRVSDVYNLLSQHYVSDETVPDKTKVCNFCYKVDANKNVIVGNLCDKFENILIQLVHESGARPLVGNVLC